MSDDELSAFVRDIGITFPELTPEAMAEAQRENEFLEALESGAVREAFESGAIGRKKPGPKPGQGPYKWEAYAFLAQACLTHAAGSLKQAKKEFIRIASAEARIDPDSAENRWYEVTEAVGRTRRVR
jgi:hypothetical protein